jgi:AcrR family transcriptional regulator
MTTVEPIDVPERIMEEATRLFVTHGYHGISMREIAEAVGVSKAGLYYHFKDKEDLFIAILTANLEQIDRIIAQTRQTGQTTREQISQILRAILGQAPHQRAIIRLASQEMAHLSQTARDQFDQLYQARFIDQLAAILREGSARGELRPINTSVATWILLGMAYPYLSPAQARDADVMDEAVHAIISIFFDGVANPADKLD